MSKVYLVGAGPGDPELITLKGRRLLARADVILFDHLANEALLAFARPEAERIYVGKKKSDHSIEQEEIISLMVDRARAGKTVVRLKGGDPFIFGRGGEEVEGLSDAGVVFEVVPGVTAPLGIAAYCGVPLTHREHTSVVTLVTGHDPDRIDWSKVSGAETVVIYMGISHARDIAARMIACGRSPDTPTLTARWATRSEQAIVMSPLGELGDRLDAADMKPPATIIIGEVVRLHDRLTWYERLPLFGQRVLVTRPEHQAEEFASRLRVAGAEPLLAPVIATVARDTKTIDSAIERLNTYDWLIFTSVNGVRFFVERLDASRHDLRSLRARICAIGPATRAAVEKLHLKVDLMPLEYVAESVVEEFQKVSLKGQRILLPRAAVARDLIPKELEERGAHIDVVEAYRTVRPPDAADRIERAMAHHPHWVTFTSASTVENFIGIAGAASLNGLRIATIGPVTSAAVREHGLHVDAEAKEYTVDGLVAALIEFGKE